MIAVCVGTQCATCCMRDAATSMRYAFDLGSAHLLIGAFNRIRYDFRVLVLKRLTITDRLPSAVATFLDNTDLGGERPFPIPAVDVVAPLPVPTPAPAGP